MLEAEDQSIDMRSLTQQPFARSCPLSEAEKKSTDKRGLNPATVCMQISAVRG